MHGVVVELGLRFTPGARENLGSNPSDPTTPNYDLFGIIFTLSIIFTRAVTVEFMMDAMVFTNSTIGKMTLPT
jgi:hypothetical protein